MTSQTAYRAFQHAADDGIAADHEAETDWQHEDDQTRHAEMLRQDRNRLIYAGLAGTFVALIMIGGSYAWVRTLKARVATTSPAIEETEQGVDAKLRALAPHEALVVSQTPSPDSVKKVRAERIGTKID